MPQLQELYQSILEVKFDRRNLSNKMLKLGILTELGDLRSMPEAESLSGISSILRATTN